MTPSPVLGLVEYHQNRDIQICRHPVWKMHSSQPRLVLGAFCIQKCSSSTTPVATWWSIDGLSRGNRTRSSHQQTMGVAGLAYNGTVITNLLPSSVLFSFVVAYVVYCCQNVHLDCNLIFKNVTSPLTCLRHATSYSQVVPTTKRDLRGLPIRLFWCKYFWK